MLSCIGGLPTWCSSLIFVAYILYVVIVARKAVFIDKTEIFFLLTLALCTLLSFPDRVFHSWERLLMFVILITSSTSMLQSDYNRNLRRKSLDTVIYICICISSVSFFCYFLNINLFEDTFSGEYYSDFNEFIGHFSGITKHSMILGPLAGISVIYLFGEFLKTKKKKSILLMFLCIGSLFFAASRGAILATLCGLVVCIFKYSRNGYKKNFVFVIISVILLFPLYQPYIDAALNKHENKGNLGVYDSRTTKFEARIDEFQKSPIYGVGFCAIDPNGKDEYNIITGSIEPGSSWLAVLSMSGLVGFIYFIVIVCKSIYRANSKKENMLLILLIFFCVHMFVEGYIFSAGNALAFIFWLVVGCCMDLKYTKVQKTIMPY